MKKLLPFLILISLGLSSCNFPLAGQTAAKTLDPAIVATRVAGTLSAVQTQVNSLSTATPDGQSLPTISVDTPEPTLTTTPTITPSPTTSTEDPKLSLGDPDYTDTLSNGSAFGLTGAPYEDDAVKMEVKNGSLLFTSFKINNGRRWRLTSRDPQDLYLEGTFKVVACSGLDTYGLLLRSPTYGDGIGYYFGVSCNGKYSLARWNASGDSNIIDWTSDALINQGAGSTNRIGLWADGASFRLYINGSLVDEIENKDISAKGYTGAFIEALENPGFTVQLEEISLWNLP